MLSRRLIVLATVSMLSLFAIGWVSDHSARVLAHSVESTERTRNLLLSIDRLQTAMAEAESGARGYVITGSPSFRADYDRGAASLRIALLELTRLTASDERERAAVKGLDRLVAKRVDLLTALMALRQAGASEEEIHANVLEGTASTSDVDDRLDELRSEEWRRFRLETFQVDSARRYAIFGPWVMSFVAALMFTWMLLQVRHTLRREQTVRNDLQRAVIDASEARLRAQEADQMKDMFLATVSHELRNPLTSIVGWCGLLSDPSLRAELLDEGLANIGDAARVQSQLVEDLLDVSRIVAGRLRLSLNDTDLAGVVDKAIASVAPSAQAKNITIRKRVEGSPPPIRADAMRLEQVCWNLLNNAVKFTPAGGSVDVAISSDDGRAELRVADNGAGIGPDLMPYIFDRFRQGDAAGTRRAGLGLGLSIVKTIVELHGGTVEAESAGPGAGTTFTMKLPLNGPAKSDAATAA